MGRVADPRFSMKDFPASVRAPPAGHGRQVKGFVGPTGLNPVAWLAGLHATWGRELAGWGRSDLLNFHLTPGEGSLGAGEAGRVSARSRPVPYRRNV